MTERLSEEDLARADELDAGATPGPWGVVFVGDSRAPDDPPSGVSVDLGEGIGAVDFGTALPDAKFIAFARFALPALVAEVREHRAGRPIVAEDAREQIARTLYEADPPCPDWPTEAKTFRDAWRKRADALLVRWPGIAAVISGPSDEMVEAAARAIVHQWLVTIGTAATFDEVSAGQMPLARREARAALVAALGGDRA